MIYTTDAKTPTKNIPVPEAERKQLVLTDDEVLNLAKQVMTIEEHYSEKKGKFCPMDTEWAKDGRTGELFIVQARPETVHSNADVNVLRTYELQEQGKILIEGKAVGEKIGSGNAHVIKSVADIGQFKK